MHGFDIASGTAARDAAVVRTNARRLRGGGRGDAMSAPGRVSERGS